MLFEMMQTMAAIHTLGKPRHIASHQNIVILLRDFWKRHVTQTVSGPIKHIFRAACAAHTRTAVRPVRLQPAGKTKFRPISRNTQASTPASSLQASQITSGIVLSWYPIHFVMAFCRHAAIRKRCQHMYEPPMNDIQSAITMAAAVAHPVRLCKGQKPLKLLELLKFLQLLTPF